MEIVQAFGWVYSTMQADSALTAALSAPGNIFLGMADFGTVPPFVAYGKQADTDILTVNAIRIYSSILMRIMAVGPSSLLAALATIADRIDALFGSVRNVGVAGGGGVLDAYRESQIAMESPQPVNGVQWSYIGGLYRIDLKGS